jgi:FKBP-type peptidyl-prolyl cis-trans isomerase (trigger factor)
MITEVRSQSPLEFVVHIETLPQIEIKKEYRDIKFKKNTAIVTDKEVE